MIFELLRLKIPFRRVALFEAGAQIADYCLADQKAVALSAARDRDFLLYGMPTLRFPPPPTRARRGTVNVFELSKL